MSIPDKKKTVNKDPISYCLKMGKFHEQTSLIILQLEWLKCEVMQNIAMTNILFPSSCFKKLTYSYQSFYSIEASSYMPYPVHKTGGNFPKSQHIPSAPLLRWKFNKTYCVCFRSESASIYVTIFSNLILLISAPAILPFRTNWSNWLKKPSLGGIANRTS